MAITRREWILGAAAAVAGCSGRRQSAPSGNSLTVLNGYDETVLGPNVNEPAQFLMFLPLASLNTQGQMEGRLAEHWEHSPDYRTWTVRMRDGIRWHDGVPVTAHDIKFNFELRSLPDIWWFTPDSFTVRVIDDLTYTITHRRDGSQGSPLDDWNVYYPKHIIEKFNPKEFYSWEFWKHPVGNGPYRHVRTVPGTMLHLEANADYYKGKPAIADVVLKFGGDPGRGSTMELLSGNVDAATSVTRTDVLYLSKNPRFRVYEQVMDDMVTILFWNHNHPLFQDRNLRRALTMAINRREMFQLLNFPINTPIFDGPFTKRQMQRGDFPEAIPYDPAQANRLLDEAGWSRRNSQGIRERAGRLFSFRVNYSVRNGGEDKAAVYIQAQLQRIGVRMEIDSLESMSQYQRLVAGDYEASIRGISMAQYSGDEKYLPTAGYRNPRFRELADKLGMTIDPDRQDQLFTEMAKLYQQDVPATALYPQVRTTIATSRLHALDRSAYPGDLTWCMDQLSLEGVN